jgi:hypothetical protein
MPSIVTVFTVKFYDEDKEYIYETKGFITRDAAFKHGAMVLQGPDGLGAHGLKYMRIEKYYKLED